MQFTGIAVFRKQYGTGDGLVASVLRLIETSPFVASIYFQLFVQPATCRFFPLEVWCKCGGLETWRCLIAGSLSDYLQAASLPLPVPDCPVY